METPRMLMSPDIAAPRLDAPETVLRFGDDDGNSPPKGPCKMYTFPRSTLPLHPWPAGWVRTVLRAATNRANGTMRWPTSNAVGRDAAIHHFDSVLKSKARNLKMHGVQKAQAKQEIDLLAAFFKEWLENKMPVTPAE